MPDRFSSVRTNFESGHTYVCDVPRLDATNADSVPVDRQEFPPVKTAFYLEGLADVTLDFNGATLCIRGDIQPFTLVDCQNVTIKNVVVENERSHYTEGTVVSSLPGRYRIRMNDKYPFSVEDGNLIVYGDGWRNNDIEHHPMMFMQFFDGKTRKGTGYTPLVNIGKTVPEYDKKHFFVHHLTAHKKGTDLVVKGGLWMKPQKRGTHVVFEHESRATGTLVALRCDNFTLDNFRILNGSGMGIIPICCHNVTINKLLFTYDEKSHGFISNAADGLHTFACSGALTMTDCVFEGMIDDALNIHGNYFLLQKTDGDRAFVKIGSLAFSDENGPISHTYYFPLREGDDITVNCGKTMDVRDRYTIKKIIPLTPGAYELILDRPVTGEEGDLIENISAQVDLTIKNCVFGKTNTHLRFQTRGKVLIENCITELPFWLTGDTTYWFESSPCTDFTVRNCRFVGKHAYILPCPETTPTKSNPYYHKNVTVENCVFDSRVIFDGRYTDNVTFIGNKCTGKKKPTVIARKCGKVTADNAIVIR